MKVHYRPALALVRTILFAMPLLITAGTASAAPTLRLCHEDIAQPPWTMPDGSGIVLDMLRGAEKRLHEHFEFHAMPWKRCIEEVRIGTMDAMIASADTPDRRDYSVLPTLPDGRADPSAALMSDNFNLYIRNGSGASWDGKTLVLPRAPVIVQRGYYVAAMLREQGFTVSESAKSAEDGLRLLAQGGADVAVLQGRETERLCAGDARFRSLITEASTPYAVLPLYLMVARKVYDAEPKRIKLIWSEIQAARASAEYKKIETAALRRQVRK